MVEVDAVYLASAFKALLKLQQSEREEQPSSLLEDVSTETLSIVFRFARYPPAWSNPKRIKLAYPLYDERTEVCLLCKAPQRKWKNVVASEKVTVIRKVIDSDKLRKKYREQKDRMELQRSYDLFLVDKHLLNCVPQFLGKDFRARKKDPIALTMSEKNLSRNVSEALSGTYLLLRQGLTAAVKVGRCDMPVEQLVENTMMVISQVSDFVANDPVFVNRIECIGLKNSNAAGALPVFYGKKFQNNVQLAVFGDHEDKTTADTDDGDVPPEAGMSTENVDTHLATQPIRRKRKKDSAHNKEDSSPKKSKGEVAALSVASKGNSKPGKSKKASRASVA